MSDGTKAGERMTYTVRRPGMTAWLDSVDWSEARRYARDSEICVVEDQTDRLVTSCCGIAVPVLIDRDGVPSYELSMCDPCMAARRAALAAMPRTPTPPTISRAKEVRP